MCRPLFRAGFRAACTAMWMVLVGFAVNAHAKTCWQSVSTSAGPASEARTAEGRDASTYLWLCAADSLSPKHREHLAAHIKPLVSITRDAVWIIDPGATFQQGIKLANALRTLEPSPQARLQAGHRLHIINSRALAEHVMASDGVMRRFNGKAMQLAALPETRKLMQRRCKTCLQRLQRELEQTDARGTVIRIPDSVELTSSQQSMPFVAHAANNAAIEQDAWFHAHDLAWIWTGMLLSDDMPDLQQGQVKQRLAVLDQFSALHAAKADAVWISSMGPVHAGRIELERQYFLFWMEQADKAIENGMGPVETLHHLRTLDGPLRASNAAMKLRHDLNLQRMIRQAEDALFR